MPHISAWCAYDAGDRKLAVAAPHGPDPQQTDESASQDSLKPTHARGLVHVWLYSATYTSIEQDVSILYLPVLKTLKGLVTFRSGKPISATTMCYLTKELPW